MDLLVIDCQNDFITGSLACDLEKEMIQMLISFLEEHPEINTRYSLDWHSPNNESFQDNGGIWPRHCEQETWGSELAEEFYKLDIMQKPSEKNMYFKGKDDKIEEYSAYQGENLKGNKIYEIDNKKVLLSGIALEFCVKETALEFLKNGFEVTLFSDLVAAVDDKERFKILNELEKAGVHIVLSKDFNGIS